MVVVNSRSSGKEGSEVNSGIQVNGLSAEIVSAARTASIDDSQTVSGSLVTVLTVEVINKTITTLGESTVRSASVGSIGVGSSIITFLTSISNAITTLGKDTLGSAAARASIRVSRSIVTDFSRVNTSVTAFLLASARTSVTVHFISIITGLTSGSINDSITAVRDSAPGSASVRGILVVFALVTFLKVIQDTVTAVPQHAVGSTSVGLSVRVVDSIITLFSNIEDSISANDLASLAPSVISSTIASFVVISNTITTEGKFAGSGSASIGNGSRVGSSVITFFTGGSINDSVTAEKSARSGASAASVTLFTGINDSITTLGKNTVGSASVGSGGTVGSTIITFLASIEGSITASVEGTISSASVVFVVRVVNSFVALLVLSFNTITAFKLAVGVAFVTVDIVSIITSLTQEVINNTVTTVGNDASGSASVGEVAIPSSVITLLLRVDNSITTVGHSAARSASVRKMIVVVGTVIAFLLGPASVPPGLDILLDSVTASAFGDRWKTIEDGLQNRVGIGTLLEQDRDNSHSVRSRDVGSVEQLNFEGESLGSNVVFAGFVEFNLGQSVRNSSVVEGSSS